MKTKLKYLKFCPKYQAVYDAYKNKPSLFQSIRENRLVMELRQAGIWDKLDVFMPNYKATYYKHYKTGTITTFHCDEDAFINWINS